LKIIFAVLGFAMLARGLGAEGNSSLSESEIENAAEGVTAAALLAQNEELRRQLSIQRESISALTRSLAESNGAVESFRRKYVDLQLRMEALGLESASKDRAKLEQRLLAAVSDLQLAQRERDEFEDQMLRLSEAMWRYLKTAQSGDAQARREVETQLRVTNELASKSKNVRAESAEPSLMSANVIGVKDEWSFVVANIGEKHGVKIGLPLRVVRDDRTIAILRVIDVRRKICGAVIEGSGKEKIKVGDRLRVDTKPNENFK
jgi:hypothetical protein